MYGLVVFTFILFHFFLILFCLRKPRDNVADSGQYLLIGCLV